MAVVAAAATLGGCREEPPAKSPVAITLPASSDSEPAGDPPPRADRPKRARGRWIDWPSDRPRDRAAAAGLFDQGHALMNQGLFAEACRRFEQCMDADPALGTLMNLAACVEKLGDNEIACDYFDEALEWARRDHNADAERYLAEHLATLGCDAPR